MKMYIAIAALLFTSMLAAASAEPPLSTASQAPAIRQCDVGNLRELGSWDDAFICHDQDMIVLRRGQTLFSLSMTDGATPKEMTKASTLADSRIIACLPSGEKLWLLLESTKAAPFAIDARSGKLSEFDIPGLTVPGSHTSAIQSHVVVKHADAVVLTISGGDRQTWPRDGNRPVYFWMSLKSGSVVRFPVGWDLDFFSRDQRIAVFQTPSQEPFQERLQAINMETGEQVAGVPDRGKEGYVPFIWTDTDAVKPLLLRHVEMREREHEHLAGISFNARVQLFNPHLEQRLSKAKEEDGFVGFRLRGRRGTLEPGSLWLVQLEDYAEPVRVETAVTDFAMLNRGNCLFTTDGHGSQKASLEAFFRSNRDKSVWNVLEGVERLTDLDSKISELSFVEDRLTVRLIESFGTRSPITLCLFHHIRGDTSGSTFPMVKREVWRRAVVVTSEGERYMTKLFREEQIPTLVWLHNSGLLITGFIDQGMTHLSSRALRLTDEP